MEAAEAGSGGAGCKARFAFHEFGRVLNRPRRTGHLQGHREVLLIALVMNGEPLVGAGAEAIRRSRKLSQADRGGVLAPDLRR